MKGERVRVWLGAGGLAAATAYAYWNGLHSGFIFDDADSTLNNPSIHRLSWRILEPPHGGITASGRPLFNASLALNWAWTGADTWSYHAVNLAGHILAGLLLFGLARRTLLRIRFPAADALGLGWAIALLWLLHPLQTESVTYIVQRTEMMMGLFYLAVLYALVRLAEAQEGGGRRAVPWALAGAMACLAGMLSKEVMVSAPVVALLYDRAFLGGSFAAAWQKRKYFLLALAATWIPLGCEVWANRDRGGTSGLDVGVTALGYWMTQGPAICHYLRLAVWPHPLVLDYAFQRQWIEHPLAALPADLAVVALAMGAIWLLVRRPRWGVLAFAFFAILAPTSLVPGNRQTLAEHRMYLALAPLIAAALIGGWRLLPRRRAAGICLVAGAVGALFVVRVRARNADYDDPERLWLDNLRYTPRNQFALCNLGAVYYREGRLADAERVFRHAAQVAPTYGAAESNLGLVLIAEHKFTDAMAHLRRALALAPDSFEATNNMGVALASLHRWEEAITWYRRAIAMLPDYHDALWNLALARAAVAENHFQAGVALSNQGRWREAIAEYEQALRWQSTLAGAYANIGNAWLALHDSARAVAALQRAVEMAPGSAACHYNLALALKAAGRRPEALHEDEIAAGLAPDLPEAANNLAVALNESGRREDALRALKAFLARHPDSALVRQNLARLQGARRDGP